MGFGCAESNGTRPVNNSKQTTPKLYTSLFVVRCRVRAYLQTHVNKLDHEVINIPNIKIVPIEWLMIGCLEFCLTSYLALNYEIPTMLKTIKSY